MAVTDRQLEDSYRIVFPIIREKCRRLLVDAEEASDVAQETFIRMWQLEPRVAASPAQAIPWAYRTSTRLALQRLRNTRTRARLAPQQGEPQEAPDGLVAARQQLLRLIQAAPEDELAVAVMSRLDGMKQGEISSALGISSRTVRRLLERFDARAPAVTEPPHE